MTPAVRLLDKLRLPYALHGYDNTVGQDYAAEAAEQMGVAAAQVFKTLVVETPKGHVVCVLAACDQLDLKAVARVSGCKKVKMADKDDAERLTGYLRGGISPLGQKTALPVWVDCTVNAHPHVYVSGGKRGLEIEIAPQDLLTASGGEVHALAVQAAAVDDREGH